MPSSEPYVVTIGIIAGFLTTLSFIPQVTRIWHTRSATDVSGSTYMIFSIGTLLWLIYGVLVKSIPVTGANAITLILSFIIVFLKWKCTKRITR